MNTFEKNHHLAVVYAALEETDSVLYYLDTIRDTHSKALKRERTEFFNYLIDDPRFIKVVEDHGIKTE